METTMYCIEYEYHDELDRELPVVVEYKNGTRIELATFKTFEAAYSAIAQLKGYATAQDDCDCEFDHLCDRHYFEHYGEHREAA
jgi:hypothetical protein